MTDAIQTPAVNVKKFTLEWNWYEAIFAVDLNVFTQEKAHEINKFWSDDDSRLDDADGDAVVAVLKLLTSVCFSLKIAHSLNDYGVTNQFDWDDGNGVEGWPKMDGSYGITIISIDEITFDADDISIKNEPLDALPPPPARPEW